MKEIVIPLATGLSIFLFGMQLMRIGLEMAARDRLRTVLLRFTKTPTRGMVTGMIATALLQSSSTVTVLTIGFVNAGVISFTQTIGIILGSNIGTTITTEILALKVEDFSVPLLLIGSVCYMIPWKGMQTAGLVIGGFGCIFLGMEAMQWVVEPLKNRGWLGTIINVTGDNLWMAVLAGVLVTAIVQSGNAVIAMTMGFFATGLISLPFAIAIVLGSNAGTCVTGLLAAIGSNRGAKRVALAHLVLNVGGILLFTPMIGWIAQLAPLLSAHPATQIAHIQTLYNLICSLIVLPFTGWFAAFIDRLLPERTPS